MWFVLVYDMFVYYDVSKRLVKFIYLLDLFGILIIILFCECIIVVYDLIFICF